MVKNISKILFLFALVTIAVSLKQNHFGKAHNSPKHQVTAVKAPKPANCPPQNTKKVDLFAQLGTSEDKATVGVNGSTLEFANKGRGNGKVKNKIKGFDFYTYCPTQIIAGVQYYRVAIASRQLGTGPDSSSIMFYCGKARRPNQKCGKKTPVVCNSPGPMFDIERGTKFNVQWINQVDFVAQDPGSQLNQKSCPTNVSNVSLHCLATGFKTPFCPEYSCSPTDLHHTSYFNYTVNTRNLAISTHMHGLEVQPWMDGNPTSWYTKNGTRGTGFAKQTIVSGINAINNTYHATQFPGTLWYHDHAMHATKHNVAQGLAGMFLIRDKNIEKQLDPKFEQIFILSARTQNYKTSQPAPVGVQFQPNNQKQAKTLNQLGMTPGRNPPVSVLGGNLVLSKNVYRIRFLNAYLKAYFTNLVFGIVDPKNTSKFTGVVPFTIIGTDSTMMQQPSYGRTSFSLGSGQRVDILIDFGIAAVKVGDVISLLGQSGDPGEPKPNTYINITIINKLKTKKAQPNINTIKFPGIKFFNLTHVQGSNMRIRPLVRDSFYTFSINSHPMFEMSQPQNPVIGSVEDWFFVNTMVQWFIPHPIHFHLITYQFVNQYIMKLRHQPIPDGFDTGYPRQLFPEFRCTDYGIDYLFGINNARAYNCRTAYPANYDGYERKFLQTQKNSKSILDPFHSCKRDAKGKLVITATKDSTCKYIHNTTSTPIPTYYRNWKESAMVIAGTVAHYKIRWARTDYDKKEHGYNYFSFPNSSVTAFPGYVYHCHFLDHEDNEMMRPIMLIQQGKKGCVAAPH